jgi:hypothetical protein
MAIDLDQLEIRIGEKSGAGRTNPIRYDGPSLTDVSIVDAKVKSSPCVAMRWLKDNSDYSFETFVRLSDSSGWQGVVINNKNDGSLYKKIEVPMRGGEASSPPSQIYINNWKILSEAIDTVSGDLDFDAMETRLLQDVGQGNNPIGYGGGSLAGVPLAQAGVMRSPCRALRWMSDNSEYRYETLVKLSDLGGSQGMYVYSKEDDSLIRSIGNPMGGGPNDDPERRIYKDNTAIILQGVSLIYESLQG